MTPAANPSPAGLAAALLQKGAITTLPVDLHQIAAQIEGVKLLTYTQAQRRLFLPQKALNAMAAASPTALLTKTQGQKQLYYLLYQPVTAPLLRMNLRQQVALHLGAILLNLPDIYAPGAQGQLLTFARHLLCPQHLLTSLKGHYSFDALWQLVMAPKSLCFDALVDCPRQLA